jgi:hypothetical protein
MAQDVDSIDSLQMKQVMCACHVAVFCRWSS